MADQTNSTAIVPFLFEGEGLVRVIKRDGAPWLVAADVCRVLGIRNVSQALQSLDDDEKGICSTDTLGGVQDLLIICEGGLYTLILRSRAATTPGTKQHRFRKWVTSEVLPTIRKTGSYRRGHGAGVSLDEIRHRMRLDAWKVARQVIGEIRRTCGNRTAAHATPQIMAGLGITIDLSQSDTLAQGELPLGDAVETVH